jgi:hypothetical protein
MSNPNKLTYIINFFNTNNIDIAFFTETWLLSSLKLFLNTDKLFQSPPNRYQGVAIMVGPRIKNIQPILEQIWTTHTIACKAHI